MNVNYVIVNTTQRYVAFVGMCVHLKVGGCFACGTLQKHLEMH